MPQVKGEPDIKHDAVECSTQASSSAESSFDSSRNLDKDRRKKAKKVKKAQPEEWKRKVKTEFCRFWLKGMACENQTNGIGCGFAHGEHELQRKKNLNKQYLTSICKNFVDSPNKCLYGSRCIFQHPTQDVKNRIAYSLMMEDNIKYTAMRIFQDIEGADVIYINTYAATTPRLQAFKKICSTNSKEPELIEKAGQPFSGSTGQNKQRIQKTSSMAVGRFSDFNSTTDED